MSDSEIKWEYHVERSIELAQSTDIQRRHMSITAKLKQLGEEGWELIGFQEKEGYFKRRMASKDGAQSLFEE